MSRETPSTVERLADAAPVVFAPTDVEICVPEFLQDTSRRLAMFAVPRRKVPDLIADTLNGFTGTVMLPNGKALVLGPEDVDLAFNDEGSFRWISDFLKVAVRPWKQAPQRRVLDRIRLIYVTLEVLKLDGRSGAYKKIHSRFDLLRQHFLYMGLVRAMQVHQSDTDALQSIRMLANEALDDFHALVDPAKSRPFANLIAQARRIIQK